MKNKLLCATAIGVLISTCGYAAVPASAPAGTHGLCKDGSYSDAAEKKGACRGHKGVKEWYTEAPAAAATVKPNAAAAAAAPATAAPPVAPVAGASKPAKAGNTAFTPAATPAPGGGPGKVWGNDSSKVYHCPSDKWYGRTKHGEYMTEAEAKAKGFHAEHGKACAS